MIYMPVDLFGSYIKGREYAIDRNWNDMNQANQVQQGWLNNDAQQLRNWFSQDTYGDKLLASNAQGRIAQNSAAGSDLDLQFANDTYGNRLTTSNAQSQIAANNAATSGLGLAVAQAGQPGAVDTARLGSQYALANNRQTRQDLPMYVEKNAAYQHGVADDRAAQGKALSNTSGQFRQAQADANLNTVTNQNNQLLFDRDLQPLQYKTAQNDLQIKDWFGTQTLNNPLAQFPQFKQQPGSATYNSATEATDNAIIANTRNLAVGNSATIPIDGVPTTVYRDENGIYLSGANGTRYITDRFGNKLGTGTGW